MFGKKLPMKQAPPQVYEEQYSEQQSQPLIQEVDPSYQPTQKQVREYAIDTLGMKLPEDQNLLYLARQGLKAPITVNWVPYQSRNGQIYYKHNITQQKTYDHPIDTQYRKKYEQIKQKAARKNLKSISLKQNLGLQGLLPNNSLASGLGLININNRGAGLSNASNLSGMGDDAAVEITIDEELFIQYQKELSQFQKRQEKQWKQYQQQAQSSHQKKIRKIKQQNEQQRNNIVAGKGGKKMAATIMQQKQKKISDELQQAQQGNLKQQLRILQKQQEQKLVEYKTVYEEDNALKIKKLEHQLQQSYQQKSKNMEQKIRKLEQKRLKQKQQRIKLLKQTRQEYEKPNNLQIASLLKSTIQDNIKNIKQQYTKKLKQKQQQLAHQLQEMKRILGADKSQNLLQYANKKQKLINISQMKIAAQKNKQLQAIQIQIGKQLENDINRLKLKLNQQNNQIIDKKKKELQAQLQKKKKQLQCQYLQKQRYQTQQIYQNSLSQRSQYETSMNNKMSQMRMKYINMIQSENKSKQKQNQVINRVLTKQKQVQIQNKQQLIKNLQKQIKLQRKQLKAILLQQQLDKIMNNSNGQGISSFLKSKLTQLNINYQSAELVKMQQMLRQAQKQYRDDKKLLVRILRGIQETAAFNINQMRKNANSADGTTPGSGILIKKYNQDVRNMRENQDMLNKFQLLVKKTLLGGKQYDQNMGKLNNFIAKQYIYKNITLKAEFQRNEKKGLVLQNYDNQLNAHKLQQVQIGDTKNGLASRQHNWNTNYNAGNTIKVQQALRQHSQFLSNVKNQLNRKLYQIRYSKY